MVTRQHTEQTSFSGSASGWGQGAHLPEEQESEQGLHRANLAGVRAPMTLSDSQLEILDMLEERPALATSRQAGVRAAEGRGFGVDVAFAAVGSLSILTGIAMLFFFAALGSILLVTGAILCAVAFEHVALADLPGDELELEQTTATAVSKANSII